ncbi:MAG: type II secretion system protein M [Gammaproteobacteria bacterium]
MKAWFMQLAAHERRLVIAGAALLVIFLLYLLAWEPLIKHRQELRQTVKEQQALVEWMRQAAREAEQLRAAHSGGAGKLPAGQSLLAVVDQSAKSSGLGTAMKRVEPEGQDIARVWFEQAKFDELVLWLEGMQRNFGVGVVSIVLERQDQPGLINARVTLQGAA